MFWLGGNSSVGTISAWASRPFGTIAPPVAARPSFMRSRRSIFPRSSGRGVMILNDKGHLLDGLLAKCPEWLLLKQERHVFHINRSHRLPNCNGRFPESIVLQRIAHETAPGFPGAVRILFVMFATGSSPN